MTMYSAFRGLLIDGKVELAKGIADHFCFEISKYLYSKEVRIRLNHALQNTTARS